MSNRVTLTNNKVDAKCIFCRKMTLAGWNVHEQTVDMTSHFDIYTATTENESQDIIVTDDDDDLDWLNDDLDEDEEIEMSPQVEASFSNQKAQLGLGCFERSQYILVFIGSGQHFFSFLRFRFYYSDHCQLERGLDLLVRSQHHLSTETYQHLICQMLQTGLKVFWDIDGFSGWQVDQTNVLEGHPNLVPTFLGDNKFYT